MAERQDEPWSQLATRIPKALHQRLKLHCVETDTSQMDFIVAAIREKLGAKPVSARSAATPKRAARTK
jgi:hypothetical protein